MATNRFRCPDCGMSDQEIGPLPEAEMHCIICLEQDGRHVRLRYWVEEAEQAGVGEIAV
jgi:hypothetical protein